MEPISWSQPGHQLNPLGSFKNSSYLGSDPGQLHLILWGCGLGSKVFSPNSGSDSNTNIQSFANHRL